MRTIVLALLAMAAVGSARAEAPPKAEASDMAELAAIQGKWVRTVRNDIGTFKFVKEHVGNSTTVTIFDADGNVVAAKKSEFRLEKTDKVRIFTFFNNVFTAGPQAGQTSKEPQSYIYRVTDGTFVEVIGLLVGDDQVPTVITWSRLDD